MTKCADRGRFEEIEAVLFDLDGTLLDFFGDAERALKEAMRRQVAMPTHWAAFFEVYVAAALRRWDEYVAGELERDQMRRLRVADALEQTGLEVDKTEAVVSDYLRLLQANPTVMPGARQVFAELGRRYRIGLVTNGLLDTSARRIERTGIGSYFETVVISEAEKLFKPDPAIFHEALRRLGVEAGRAVFVGDSLEYDVAGARAAGMRSVHYCRDGSAAEGDPQPDMVIRDLRELLEIL